MNENKNQNNQNNSNNNQNQGSGRSNSRGPRKPRNQYGETIKASGEDKPRQNQGAASEAGPRNQDAKPQNRRPRNQEPKAAQQRSGNQEPKAENKPRNQQPRAKAEPKESKIQSVVNAIRPKRQKPLIADVDQPAEEVRKSSRSRRKPASKPAGDVQVQTTQPESKPASKSTGRVTRRGDGGRSSGRGRGAWGKPKEEPINYTATNSNDKDIVRIMPLGGLDEIGKNMTAIEYRDEIIVIDCGLKFPEDEMLGIDSVIPDTAFLEHNMHKVKGFFITHGHEDHIGALPHILKKINVPVYSTRLTLGLIENKLREHNIANKVKLHTVKPRDIIRFNHINVEFIKTNHSIADASALAIHTAAGVLIHTGDFKVDLTPVAGDTIDLARFAQLGEEGVLALMADSTNAERPGYTQSESTIGENFDKLFAKAPGRILVATFSSNIDRIQQVVGSARKTGRKVVINGRSMENNVNVARELGYLEIEENNIVPVDEMNRYRDDQLVIMTTGSQGEPMAALSRMALGEHRTIRIKPSDTVIFSSHPIPGNEKGIFKTINLLYKLGAEVIYDSKEDVHVSGHACQEELKLIQALVKPKYFVPVHGEYRMLKIHADLAKQMGMDSKNILIPELGDIIELSRDKIRKNGKVQNGAILVDGLGVGDVGSVVLRDRKHLSEDGMVTVVVTVDSQSGSVIAGPDLISRGFIFVKEAEKLMEDARLMVKKILDDAEGPKMRNTEFIQNQIRDQLKNFLFRKTKRSPMIMAIIMEI